MSLTVLLTLSKARCHMTSNTIMTFQSYERNRGKKLTVTF